LLEVFGEFFVIEARSQVWIGGNDGAPALLGEDYAFALEFEVGAFHRDDADAEGHGKLANGGDFLAGLPVADGYPLLHLLHDLQVHWAAVGLGDNDVTVHVDILSIHSIWMVSRGFFDTLIE
jgi:hypothetical protein